jgi:hypothetical protein
MMRLNIKTIPKIKELKLDNTREDCKNQNFHSLKNLHEDLGLPHNSKYNL